MICYEDSMKRMVNETGIEEYDADKLYRIFFETFNEKLKQFENAIEQKDFAVVQKLAHKLKGTSGNLRLDQINELASRVEETAQKGDEQHCIELINMLTLSIS